MGCRARCGKDIVEFAGVVLSGNNSWNSWICDACIKELPDFFQNLLCQNGKNTNMGRETGNSFLCT